MCLAGAQHTLKDDGLSNEEYHAHSAISKSGLDEINKSPWHYWKRYLDPDKPPQVVTDAMKIGTAVHTKVLEPNCVDDRLQCIPIHTNVRTKAGKEELEKLRASHPEAEFFPAEKYDMIMNMGDAVIKHPKAKEYLSGFGEVEQSLFWDIKDSNGEIYQCKSRPDFVREDGLIVDLKTSIFGNQRGFNRKAWDLRYHVQAAFYSWGYEQVYKKKPKAFVFVVVEKSEPYPVSVFTCSEDFILYGEHAMNYDIKTYIECKRNDVWPGYNHDEPMELDVPYWVKSYGE